MSWERPMKMSARPTGPSGPSKTYFLSTRTMGNSRRLVFSASRSLVSSFSLSSSSLRAASQSWREVTAGRLIVVSCPSDRSGSGRFTLTTMKTPPDGQIHRASPTKLLRHGSRLRRCEAAHLDCSKLCGRVPGGHSDGLVQVGAVDHVIAGHLLFGLGERAVSDQLITTADPHGGRVCSGA